MTTTTIKNKKDLDNYISENGDYNPEITYLSQNQDGECFAIFGCTYASEAFNFVGSESSLIITEDDYSAEIDAQTASENPELNGFYLT